MPDEWSALAQKLQGEFPSLPATAVADALVRAGEAIDLLGIHDDVMRLVAMTARASLAELVAAEEGQAEA
jgi:hypothetical protein